MIKQLYTPILLAFTAVTLCISCSKSSSPSTTTPTTPTTEALVINASRTSVEANNFDEVTFTVKDANGADITASSTILVDGATVATKNIIANVAKQYSVKATRGTVSSNTITVNATTPSASPFTQKLYAEDYTGAWCGHCPRVGVNIENYAATQPKLVYVTVHNNDALQYQFEAQMRQQFGVTGFPTVTINRDTKWNETNAAFNTELTKWAPLGLAIESVNNNGTITGKAKVKYQVSTSIPFKIVVLLIENNIVLSQTNYGYHNLPNPISNYLQKNVLRKASTDIFGDAIPTNVQVKDAVYEKDFTFSTAGYVASNLKIVAFVEYNTNTLGRKGVVNVQTATVGQTKNFD